MIGSMDIALSSRVRLARNLKDYPFPSRMTDAQVHDLIDEVDAAINKNGEYLLMRMENLPQRERKLLVERHMISPDLAKTQRGAAFINREETVSIMVCEEDHLRIQCIEPGLNLKQADAICAAIDQALSKELAYAFDNEFGYLSACPTNIGSGMRASVMLHLPALSLIGQCDGILAAITKLGYAVRGIYGEGSGAPGHIYQISNQMTLGILEEDILTNLAATVQHIIDREKSVREPFYKGNRVELEDRIFRSLGALRYARRLGTGETMEYLSNLKLGASLGILPEDAQAICNRLLTDIQGASLETRLGKELDRSQRAQARATLLRSELHSLDDHIANDET
ncbi:protein arginine kinase [Christensenellaceae bacterium OttesenSCG-928-M15]|nr:protein arginine kinase [Christensenellaceae bacterium OttesenSCG-928-M15]